MLFNNSINIELLHLSPLCMTNVTIPFKGKELHFEQINSIVIELSKRKLTR